MQDKITVTGDVYVNQHLSDLLCSLTHGRDRWITARRRLDRALSFAISSDRTFQVLGMRHMIHSIYLVDLENLTQVGFGLLPTDSNICCQQYTCT